MGKYEKLYRSILLSRSDANVHFPDESAQVDDDHNNVNELSGNADASMDGSVLWPSTMLLCELEYLGSLHAPQDPL